MCGGGGGCEGERWVCTCLFVGDGGLCGRVGVGGGGGGCEGERWVWVPLFVEG